MKVKVRAVILDADNKILLQQIATGANFWCLPGGTLEEWETLEVCLVRELVEELAVSGKIGEIAHVQSFVSSGANKPEMNGKSVVDVWYFIENPEDFREIDLSKASHGFETGALGWFGADELPEWHAPKYLSRLMNTWKENGKRFVA